MPTEDFKIQLNWTRRLAAAIVTDPGMAEDLAQDTWVRFLESPPKAGLSQRAWLGKVMRNLWRERWRRERLELGGEIDPEAKTASVEQLTERAEAQRALLEIVLGLDRPTREVLLLTYWAELDSAAIGERLGMSASSVRNRRQRGLAEVRRRLESEHGDEASRMLGVLVPLGFSAGVREPAAVTSAGGMSWLPLLLSGALLLTGLVALPLWMQARSEGVSLPLGSPSSVSALGPTEGEGEERSARRESVLTQPDQVDDSLREGQDSSATPVAGVLEEISRLEVEVLVDGEPATSGTVLFHDSPGWLDRLATGERRAKLIGAGGKVVYPGEGTLSGSMGYQANPLSTIVQRQLRRKRSDEKVVLQVGTARLEGRAWKSDGRVAAGVEVQLGMRIGYDYGALQTRCVTDDAGNFAFEGLLAQDYWLYADVGDPGGKVRVHGTLERGEARRVELGGQQGRVLWSGRVVNEAGAVAQLRPLQRHGLEFYLRSEGSESVRVPTMLSEEGSFSAALFPGQYDVYLIPPEGRRRRIAEGAAVSVDQREDLVLRGARIHGVGSLAATGLPLDPSKDGEAQLVLRNEDELRTFHVTYVGSEGRFVFEGVPQGRWLLEGERLGEDPIRLVIGAGDRQRVVDLTLQ